MISETSEKFKVSIRNIRRKYIDLVKDAEKDKSLSIDESKKNQDQVQKSTDNSIIEIDNLTKQKENEIESNIKCNISPHCTFLMIWLMMVAPSFFGSGILLLASISRALEPR